MPKGHPQDTRARILALVEQGPVPWCRMVNSRHPAAAVRRAVDELLAAGELVEVWLQAPGRTARPHYLGRPGATFPGEVAELRTAPAGTGKEAGQAGGTPCPWCRQGAIVLHERGEPWEVTETGERAGDSSEHFPAGIATVTFTTAPVEWFSCSSCAMTGTFSFLALVLAGRVGSSAGQAPTVRAGTPQSP